MRYKILIALSCIFFINIEPVYKSLYLDKKQKFVKRRAIESLFKKLGCRYINRMILDSKIAWQINAHASSTYLKNKSYYDQLSKQYQKDVVEKTLAPMYLQYVSDNVGYGVFAQKFIKKGDCIGVYAGELRPIRTQADAYPEDVDYAWFYFEDTKDGKKMVIDGKYMGNELRFINDDKNPNVFAIGVIVDNCWYLCYVADRDILKDEQLTISYGSEYWQARQITPEPL